MVFTSKTICETRVKEDSFGPIEVPAHCYYGAETARSMKHFNIGLSTDQMPLPMIEAFGLIKKVSAMVNVYFGLEKNISTAIIQACDDIIKQKLNNQFFLSTWQTVSRTQTNVNFNEVISNRAIEILGGVIGSKTPVHPINHVNKNQSSDYTFSTAMHIAAFFQLHNGLHPALINLQEALKNKVPDFSSMSISMNIERLTTCQSRLCELNINDTSAGKTINIPKDFRKNVVQEIARLTGFPFIDMSNKFDELNTYNLMVELSGVLNTLAVSLMNIVNDICLLISKPRCASGESILYEIEPGSSIMPGQVNLAQYEVMTMVAAQVMNNHLGLTVGVSMGSFKLNVLKPLIIKNILHSIRILRDFCSSFTNHFLVGIKLITHASTTYMSELPIDNSILDNKKDIEDNFEQRNNLSTVLPSLTRPTTPIQRAELWPNGILLSSGTESYIVPHLYKADQPEKFISDSSPSSTNEKVFGNVGGGRLTTATTLIDYNKYNMEGEELIITKNINTTCQSDNLSSYKDVSMAPLRHSTSTSNNNLDQVSSDQQQQQPFVSTTPARHSQEVKRRSISTSPPRLTNNNLSSISKVSNNNSIKNKPLDSNGEPNTPISSMESPLISMMQMVNNLKSSTSPPDSPNNYRTKKFMKNSNFEHTSKSMDHINRAAQHTQFQNIDPHHQNNLPSSRRKRFKMPPHHHTIDPNGIIMHHSNNPSCSSQDLSLSSSLPDLQQQFNSLLQSPLPSDQQQKYTSFSTMMSNNFIMKPIHHPTSHMYPSNHSTHSYDVETPPQQEQQLTEEQLIHNLAQQLKKYPPND
ncbi:unnamed protein product [Rotaria sp. Silwood2]|nr:unnamed protein product [Rotaria sp. Silwood2]